MALEIPILPLLFGTPDTPDLGCFVRRDHEFEINATNFHAWAEPPPYDENFEYIPHQVYFRIACGEAGFYQRVHAWMRNTWDPYAVLFSTPDWTLGGDWRPYPSDWEKFSPQSGPMIYWFAGEYRNPSGGGWQWDAAVGHSYDIYENGTLSTVKWDDTGGDMDMDDLVVEVAVVYRRSYFSLFRPAVRREADLERFVKELLPAYRDRDKGHAPADAGDDAAG